MTHEVAIMSVDPGGTTGVARGMFAFAQGESTGKILKRKQWLNTNEVEGDFLQQAIQLVAIWKLFSRLAKNTIGQRPLLVVESFILRPGKASADPAQLMPVRIAAALEALVPVVPEYQTPSMAKGYATDERLREWGLWKVGSAHERDAIRHLAYKLHSLER